MKKIILDDYEKDIEEHLEDSTPIDSLHHEMALVQSAAAHHKKRKRSIHNQMVAY